MKRLLILAGLLLGGLALSASSEALNPKEPITLDLRDAKLTDVITTLGAMANLAVVIEPGIGGRVTIRLEAVPFDQVLDLLSKQNGISIRVEVGNLVASRVRDAPVAAATTLPEKFRDAPRILLAEYARAAANPPPLVISTTWNGEEICSIVRIGGSGGGLLEVPLSKTDNPETLVVADMGYDPVLKRRTVALEAVDPQMKRAFSLAADDVPVSIYQSTNGKSLRLMVSQAPKLVARLGDRGDCGQLVFQPSRGGAPINVGLQVAAVSEEGMSPPVFSAQVQTAPGTVFRALTSEADPEAGPPRGYAVTGYVSRDGKSVALAFRARTTWSDPADGRQYSFTQEGIQVGFIQLNKWPVTLKTIVQPGVATSRALSLSVVRQENIQPTARP